MRLALVGVGGAVVVALSAARAVGQSPEERARIESWRAEYAALSDSTVLLARERAGIERAKADRDNPLIHLELGFLAYRLGEVTGARQHYDDAGGEFEWATELRPDWPYPWYGLGLSELALGEHPSIAIENIRQALGKDFLSKAAAAFARAAEADPAFAQAVIDLADAARRQRIHQRLDVAQRALRAAAATGAGSLPALQLARGRVEREMGEGDSALVAFRAYVRVGGDTALGLLEEARTLFFLRQPDQAVERYFAGAARPSAEARAAYRSDIAWIATSEELASFDTTAAAGVRGWLARFWAARDAEDVRGPNERLVEHYRRYFYAWRQFRLTSPHRHYTNELYRSDQTLLDDRGVIYMRHGEPDERAQFVSPSVEMSVEANESWLYLLPAGRRIFHFVARGDVQDFKLVESLADVLGDSALAWQARGRLPPIAEALFESRASLDPAYGRIAVSSTAQGTALATERRAGRIAIREGTTTDSYPLRFDERLQSQVTLYAVSGPDERARTLLVFAIPGNRLVGQRGPGGTRYPLTIRVAAPGTGRGMLLDTTRVFRAAGDLQAGQILGGYVEFPLPPDTYALRVAVLEPGAAAGDVIEVDDFAVPDFRAGGLVVSDLVLGDRASGLHWIVSSDTVPLSPRGAYLQGGTAELYYEVHGLAAGASYRARIQVRGKGGGGVFARIGRLFGGGPPVSFSFEGVVARSPYRARQTVNLAPLGPGEYVLTLTVTDPATRREAVREVPLRVVEH